MRDHVWIVEAETVNNGWVPFRSHLMPQGVFFTTRGDARRFRNIQKKKGLFVRVRKYVAVGDAV